MQRVGRPRKRKAVIPLTEAQRARVEATLPLLDFIAASIHRTLPREVELADLQQWGVAGLADAARSYDESRGAKFDTFASPRIRGAILDGIRSMDYVPRLERQRQRREGKPVKGLVSLSRKWFETDSGRDLLEVNLIEDRQSAALLESTERRDWFNRVTKGLTRAERLIIILYYLQDMNMREVGDTLDLAESRVSQMHSSILARLKARMTASEAMARVA